MRRIEMTEVHDHPHFPGYMRDLVTDALEALWEFGSSYRVILPRLYEGMAAGGGASLSVVDLCSGGGGPWPGLARRLEEYGGPVDICLTDKYPNRTAFERISTQFHVNRVAESDTRRSVTIMFAAQAVDATRVPREMRGFRTMFSSFHHFGPVEARAVLADAVAQQAGIGIFEVAQRGMKTLFVLCFTPLLVLWLTPKMRPFRWWRLLWTYLLPVVPFVIWYDGIVSCLRAYSEAELREMAGEVPGYRWEIGEERTGLLPVTYMIGRPGRQIEQKPVRFSAP